jgi:hypothetical protein
MSSRGGGPPASPRCPLGSAIAESMDREAIKKNAWVKDGILVLALDDPELSGMDKEFVKLLGNRRYGRHDGNR